MGAGFVIHHPCYLGIVESVETGTESFCASR